MELLIIQADTGKPLHKYGHNERPYALHMRALSRKSVIRKTGTVLVRNGTKYDGQFFFTGTVHDTSLARWINRVRGNTLAVDVPCFDSCSDGSTRLETRPFAALRYAK